MSLNLANFKWNPFIILFGSYVFYTWNRKSFSMVLPSLIEEGLSKSTAGSINSAQNVAYAISKFVAGILSDSANPSVLLSLGLVCGGLTTIAFSSVNSSSLFIALWFLNGLAQGFGWPACVKILKLRYTSSEFALLWSFLSCSANLSIFLNSIVSAIISINYGWKACLNFAGLVSIGMGIISYLLIGSNLSDSTKPLKHKKQKNASSKDESSKGRWYEILFHPLMLFLLFTNFVLMLIKNSFTDWSQLYLIQENGQDNVNASIFTGSVEIGGIVGTIVSGYASEFAMKSKKVKYSESRRLVAVIGFMVCLCISLTGFCLIPKNISRIYLILLGSLIGAFIYGPINVSGIVSSSSVPQHISGTVHSFFSFAGNVGGIMAGLPIAAFGEMFSWINAFWLLNFLCILNSILLISSYRLWNIPLTKRRIS